jgi:hypothetical protein
MTQRSIELSFGLEALGMGEHYAAPQTSSLQCSNAAAGHLSCGSVKPSFGTSAPKGPEPDVAAWASRSLGKAPGITENFFSSPPLDQRAVAGFHAQAMASALREPYPRAASVRGKQPNYHGAKNDLENDVAC